MSNGNLLKEGTIRRFMKLANVDTMTNNFLSERYKAGDEEEDKKMEESEADETEETLEEQDLPEEEDELAQTEPGAEEEELELGDDLAMDEPAEMGEADISLTEEEAQLLIDLGERLKEAMGAEPMEDEPVEDEPMADDPMADDPMADEPEGEDPGMGLYENRDKIVQEVLKRVTKRIVTQRLNK